MIPVALPVARRQAGGIHSQLPDGFPIPTDLFQQLGKGTPGKAVRDERAVGRANLAADQHVEHPQEIAGRITLPLEISHEVAQHIHSLMPCSSGHSRLAILDGIRSSRAGGMHALFLYVTSPVVRGVMKAVCLH